MTGGQEPRLLAAACLTTTLVPISSTMIAVALPDVRDDFGLSVAAAVWLVSSYLVVTAAAQLPLVALAFLAVWRWLHVEPREADAVPGVGRFDLVGSVLLLLTLSASAVLINQLSADRPAVLLLGLFAAAAALAFAFTRQERRHPRPVLDLAVLRVRAVAAAGLAIGASNLAMYLVLLAVPLPIEDHASSAWAGVILAPMLIGSGLLAPVGGRRLGLSTSAIMAAGAEALPAAQAGVAAGVSSSSRYLGSILGTSLLAVLVDSGTGRPVFAVAAAAAVVSAFAAAAFAPRSPTSPVR